MTGTVTAKEDDMTCENEVEVDVSDFNLIWENSGYDDVKELEVETCFDTEEEVNYHDAEVEDYDYYCFAEDCYDN